MEHKLKILSPKPAGVSEIFMQLVKAHEEKSKIWYAHYKSCHVCKVGSYNICPEGSLYKSGELAAFEEMSGHPEFDRRWDALKRALEAFTQED